MILLAILHKLGDGVVLLDSKGRLVVGEGTRIVQLLLAVVHHEAEVIHLFLQVWVIRSFQWLYHSITPWVELKAGALDLVDALST